MDTQGKTHRGTNWKRKKQTKIMFADMGLEQHHSVIVSPFMPHIPSYHNRRSLWCPRLSPSPRHRSPQTGEVMWLCWNLTAEKSGCGPGEGKKHRHVYPMFLFLIFNETSVTDKSTSCHLEFLYVLECKANLVVYFMLHICALFWWIPICIQISSRNN